MHYLDYSRVRWRRLVRNPYPGVLWFALCVVGIGWFWGTVLRDALHLLACGDVAVLTELIVRGKVGNGSEAIWIVILERGLMVILRLPAPAAAI